MSRTPSRLRTRLVSVAAAVGIAAGSVVAGAAPAAAAPGSGFGFAAGGTLLTLPQGDLDRELDAAANLGAEWLRVEVSWRNVEPQLGVLDWSNVDRVIESANRHGIQVLGLVSYAPSWAQVPGPWTLTPGGRPADPQAFGNFAGRAAERYASTVSHWEIWNEPNLPLFFSPMPDVDAYAAILRASYGAIHAAVPGATVISGGVAIGNNTAVTIAPETFVDELYKRGAASYTDAIAVHPYTFPFTPYDDQLGNWNDVAAVRDVLVRNGDAGKKIWITEFGAPTGVAPDAVNDGQQARILADGITASEGVDFTGPIFVYSIRDNGPDLADREQNFGVLRGDFSEKPSADVLRNAN
ncbi:beta-galactosidase [Rhodococcus sp. P1Y]|uniref:beta-galactosidase n=1 Tax=Rhodococcus sp. P1Y TaxID=1302308 RepID=UPI0012939891|nr:beta-galactosidase [Rhodococcus sp. P1Y]